jgi:hypothetical protein
VFAAGFPLTKCILMTQSGEITKHQYPNWSVQASNTFEADYRSYLHSWSIAPELKQTVLDATIPGRRIRPTLYYALWKCRHGSYPENPDNLPALAIELFHTASIIVDDIADQEVSRRNKIPLYRLYDLDTAILTSHYFVAKGYRTLLDSPSGLNLSSIWTQCYTSIVTGQSFDLVRAASLTIHKQQRHALEKTVPFFSFIASTLNIVAEEARPGLVQMLEMLGECFQISNDVIDLMYLESAGRYDESSRYRLSPSHLIPRLVDSYIVSEDEVIKILPYKRLLEISRAAQQLIGDPQSYLENLFGPVCATIYKINLFPCERDIALDFIEQTTKPSFWLHYHG